MSFVALESSRLVGALGIQLIDAVAARAADVPARVTAIRTSDGFRTAGVAHGGGVTGFLTLPAGTYQLLVEPDDPRFLPTLRTATIAAVPTPQLMPIELHPAPQYPPSARSVVLRGTVRWNRPDHAPARWALVWGSVDTNPWPAVPPIPPTNVMTAWTRTDTRGEFELLLRTAGRDSDGNMMPCDATIEIHALDPPATPPPEASLDDLPLDDADIATLRASVPLRRTLDVADVADGTAYSLNADSYLEGTIANLVVLVS